LKRLYRLPAAIIARLGRRASAQHGRRGLQFGERSGRGLTGRFGFSEAIGNYIRFVTVRYRRYLRLLGN